MVSTFSASQVGQGDGKRRRRISQGASWVPLSFNGVDAVVDVVDEGSAPGCCRRIGRW